ncbi:RNI-like protein [Ramicandelaber brevisporus]|nr:RNI-like protein [Ramicandelaber brevisporus]
MIDANDSRSGSGSGSGGSSGSSSGGGTGSTEADAEPMTTATAAKPADHQAGKRPRPRPRKGILKPPRPPAEATSSRVLTQATSVVTSALASSWRRFMGTADLPPAASPASNGSNVMPSLIVPSSIRSRSNSAASTASFRSDATFSGSEYGDGDGDDDFDYVSEEDENLNTLLPYIRAPKPPSVKLSAREMRRVRFGAPRLVTPYYVSAGAWGFESASDDSENNNDDDNVNDNSNNTNGSNDADRNDAAGSEPTDGEPSAVPQPAPQPAPPSRQKPVQHRPYRFRKVVPRGGIGGSGSISMALEALRLANQSKPANDSQLQSVPPIASFVKLHNEQTQWVTHQRTRQYTTSEALNLYLDSCASSDIEPVTKLTTTFTDYIRRRQPLTSLNLSGEPLNGPMMSPFAEMLDLNFGLRQLDLEGCSIDSNSAKLVLHSLLYSGTVEHLNLAHNLSLSNGLRYVAIFLQRSLSIKQLDLTGVPIDDHGASYFVPALKQSRSLEVLILDGCKITSSSLAVLAYGLRASPTLHTVSLRGNQLNRHSSDAIALLLSPPSFSAPAVRRSSRRPSNASIEPIPTVVPNTATSSSISGQPPRRRAAASRRRRFTLSQVRQRGLTSLDLSSNRISGCVRTVAFCMSRNSRLRSLSLANCGLDEVACSLLAPMLASNSAAALESLNLSNNPRLCGSPGIAGIDSLRRALLSNTVLRSLFLSNTGLNTEGCIALAEFLPETKSLRRLDVSNNMAIYRDVIARNSSGPSIQQQLEEVSAESVAGLMALSLSMKINHSLICVEVTIPPNNEELERLSQDILRICVRNMEEQHAIEQSSSNSTNNES